MSRARRYLLFARESLWHVVVNGVAGSAVVPRPLRGALYRRAGLDVRTNKLDVGIFFAGRDASIGDSFVNRGVRFYNFARVEIGDGCSIAMEVAFLTGTHEIGTHEKRGGPGVLQPVRVGDGCWLGARVLVLPGVTIGAGCVVAAGAVVASDCEPDGFYAGVPARRIRELE